MEYQNEKEYNEELASVIAELQKRIELAREIVKLFGIEKEVKALKKIMFADEVLRLLKNSKWINAYPTTDDIKDIKKTAYEDGYHSGYSDGEDDATDYLD